MKPRKASRLFSTRWRLLLPPAALLWNQLVYWGGAALAETRHHYQFSTALDRAIPLIPWTVCIYFGCYAFWALHYCLCAAVAVCVSTLTLRQHVLLDVAGGILLAEVCWRLAK